MDLTCVTALTGPVAPQPGIPACEALPVWPRQGQGVWVVGAHGGSGESTVADTDPILAEAGHAWPGSDQPCVLVARTSASGLLAAQDALRQWASGGSDSVLLGLLLVADAPGRLPKPLRDFAALVGGGAPRVWRVDWSAAIRLGEPDPAATRTFVRAVTQLSATQPAATQAAQHRSDAAPVASGMPDRVPAGL